MKVLAFDTATAACSAAVRIDGRIVAHRFTPMARGQSEALMPMIVDVMAEAGIAFAELDLIGVTVGPGAFTGLRIGLAAARGLGLAAALPVAGVLTTEAIAYAVPAAERAGRTIVAVVDAKRADVFVQRFDEDLAPLGEVCAMAPESLASWADERLLLLGDGVAQVAPYLPEARIWSGPGVPDAAVFAALVAERWPAGATLPPTPVYIRPPDVTLPTPRPSWSN